jgi:transaldolase
MSVLVDSAVEAEVAEAAGLGFVTGVTTNPALLAAAGTSAEAIIPRLCALVPGIVFYQLIGASVDDRREDGERILALAPRKVGIKIPATTENMALVAHFASHAPVAVTAIFSGAQGIAACAAGARYLLPYVNRTTRLRGDGPGFVRLLRQVADASGTGTEVLAASVKSSEEALESLLAGAQHLSLPLEVLRRLGEDPLSHDAIRQFDQAMAAR